METRQLGKSGVAVSVLGLGCNAFGERIGVEGTREVLAAARDVGITFLDTADCYGSHFGASEEAMGGVLGGRTEGWVIATKGGFNPKGFDQPPDTSRKRMVQAVEDSLRRLRIDCIDFYQVHIPDSKTPIKETLGALDDMVREGKIRAIGCSNFGPTLIREADEATSAGELTRFSASQDEYHLLSRDAGGELVATLTELGMSLIPYFPLAGGLLTGKYRGGTPEGSRFAKNPGIGAQFTIPANLARVEALASFAEERGCSLPDVAIGWLAAQPVVASVIAGATSAEQVRANAASIRWRPTDADRTALDAILSA